MFINFVVKNYAVHEIMCNIVEPNGLQITIRCMCITYWILKAADVRLKYVILLFHCNSGYKNMPLCHMYSPKCFSWIPDVFEARGCPNVPGSESWMDILTLGNQHTIALKDPVAHSDLEERPFQTGLWKSAWGVLYVYRDVWKFAMYLLNFSSDMDKIPHTRCPQNIFE